MAAVAAMQANDGVAVVMDEAMQAAAERTGWALEGFRLEFRGKCPNCQR